VSQHEQFVQADLDQDPNVLWIMIRETHLTAVHGVGLGALELVQMKNKFGQLRQKPGASIGEFKKEFDLQYEVLLGAGIAATAQPELAMLFLSKLDPQRYAGMLAHLTNDATLGRAFPQTLHGAWSVTSGWKTASAKIAAGSDMHCVRSCRRSHRFAKTCSWARIEASRTWIRTIIFGRQDAACIQAISYHHCHH
jgi:hypothetical protein